MTGKPTASRMNRTLNLQSFEVAFESLLINFLHISNARSNLNYSGAKS